MSSCCYNNNYTGSDHYSCYLTSVSDNNTRDPALMRRLIIPVVHGVSLAIAAIRVCFDLRELSFS